MSLAGRACAVFGFASTRSLAWGIASSWNAAGASISIGIASERFRSALDRATAEWPTPPHIIVCDVTSDASISSAVDSVGAAHNGRLHALAHSIASAPMTAMRVPLLETSRADFLAAHDVSAFSLIALTRAAMPLFSNAGGGSVCSLSYLGAVRAAPNYRVMGAAKASLEATSRALAAELGPRSIRVNVISSGPVDTLAARGISGFTDLRMNVAARSPLARDVTLHDVGALATFLASDGASGITGQTLYVDGGFSAVV